VIPINVMINLYSILILVILWLHSDKQEEKRSLQYRLYMLMLDTTIVLLLFDIFSRMDTNAYAIYPVLNQLGNFVVFSLSPVLPSIWLVYVVNQLFQDEERSLRLLKPLILFGFANLMIVVLSLRFGWYYSIDLQNIYHRGPYFTLPVIYNIALLSISFVYVMKNMKTIHKNHRFTLIFFPLFFLFSVVLQVVVYGVPILLNSVVLSLLFVSLNIQNHGMNTDYLTGVNNRKKLESYLKDKVRNSTEKKSFSAIMIDIDNFKSINDTFGHDMGDSALQATVKLLNGCIRNTDFISRYGGDEFFMILSISEPERLQEVVDRIRLQLSKFNASERQVYTLQFSMGYGVYDVRSKASAQEFENMLDQRLYEEKQRKSKETSETTS